MEITSKHYSFLLEKTPIETLQQFYLRSQYICVCLDNHPHMIKKLEYITHMSFLWIALKYMNHEYSATITKNLHYLFSSSKKKMGGVTKKA